MRFSAILTALGLLAFGAGNSFAGDCLRINPSAGAAFTTGAYSQGFSGGCSGAYTDAPTQTLEIRGFSTGSAYVAPLAVHAQPVIVRQQVAPVYAAPLAVHAQPVIVRQQVAPVYAAPLAVHAQPVIVRQQVVVRRNVVAGNGGGASGVLGVVGAALRTVGNVAGAIIGRP
jgi:hypothetical protein